MVKSNDKRKQNVKVPGTENKVDVKIKYYIHANCFYGIKRITHYKYIYSKQIGNLTLNF
jgi:hypothetical protein